jgi:replicative DNA helicase
MLLSRGAITDVMEILDAEDFYRPTHSQIFQAIADLTLAGEPVDQLTVASELGKRGELVRIGGAPYLHTCASTVPTAANAGYYARLVKDKARLRRLIETGLRLQQLGYSDAISTEEVDAAIAKAGEFFTDIDQPSGREVMWNELIKDWREWQQADTWIMNTPWPELDRKLHGGYRKGEMIIVGGRPGDGKSNAGLNMVLHAAQQGHKATIFSVEMDKREVTSRALAAGSWSPVGQIIGKSMESEVWERVEEFIHTTEGMNLGVVDDAYITVEQIVAHCRAARPDVIFVDYAQLIEASNPRASREQVVAHITRSLKVAAKHLQMVVIVAAQLNRGPEQSKRPPVISDLRESGAAEQDADVVLLLHRPPEENGTQVKIIVGKNRNGPTGVIPLVFRGQLARIG